MIKIIILYMNLYQNILNNLNLTIYLNKFILLWIPKMKFKKWIPKMKFKEWILKMKFKEWILKMKFKEWIPINSYLYNILHLIIFLY